MNYIRVPFDITVRSKGQKVKISGKALVRILGRRQREVIEMGLARSLKIGLAVMVILGTLFMAAPSYAWRGHHGRWGWGVGFGHYWGGGYYYPHYGYYNPYHPYYRTHYHPHYRYR